MDNTKTKLQLPLSTKNIENFINTKNSNSNLKRRELKSEKITITLTQTDLNRLEKQIDRAIDMRIRTKNRTDIIRMAIIALDKSPNEVYQELYKIV